MQPTKKLSQLPQDTSPVVTDKLTGLGNGVTVDFTISDLITLFFNNIPAAAATSTTLASDTMQPFIKVGTGVWTADNAGVNRNASMTALTAYHNGQKLTVSAVTSRTFTASKDTYVDLLNTAGVGTLVYTEVANNAASPALAANSVRVAIVVTGATTIAAAASINQGQLDRVLPIASSVPYATTDSLGNLICPRDPFGQKLGQKQTIADTASLTNTTVAEVTGYSMPVMAPGNRDILVEVINPKIASGTTMNVWTSIWKTAVGGGGTQIQEVELTLAAGAYVTGLYAIGVDVAPAAGLVTYKVGFRVSTNGATISGASTAPNIIRASVD